MKTRLIAGMVAVVLAIAGTVVLVGYVRGADSRAMAGLETVNVLVAAAPIPEGAASADVAKLSAVKQLPATAALPDRVTSVDELAGQVALVALEPGEQLLASKFGSPPSTAPDALIIPPELQQVTVLLELQRALGGQIKAGDTVGVFLSATDTKQTHLTAHKVLVTKVERATPKDAAPSGGDTATGDVAVPAPTDLTEALLVTLATSAPVAEKIVFAANFGTVWLSNEPPTADEGGAGVVDAITVFK
jgi:pilus assembly protein CpaB